jgi:ferrous iron transport protein A
MHAEPALEAAALETAPAEGPAISGTALTLSQVGVGQSVVIREIRSGVSEREGGDIGLRLLELGFVEGEVLRVIAHGYPGGEPIAVRIGNTTFALRRFEADHVLVLAAPQAGSKSR